MFAAGCVLFFLELESWDLLFFVFCTTTAFFRNVHVLNKSGSRLF